MITDENVADALDRIARTADGMTLYLLMQRTMMALPSTSDSGALLVHHGERILASRIRSLMSKGIEESGGREHASGTDDPGKPNPGRPVVFAVNQPTSVRPVNRGASRRGPIYPDDTDGKG